MVPDETDRFISAIGCLTLAIFAASSGVAMGALYVAWLVVRRVL